MQRCQSDLKIKKITQARPEKKRQLSSFDELYMVVEGSPCSIFDFVERKM